MDGAGPRLIPTPPWLPQVFRLKNFFTADEADELIENTMRISDPVLGLHRSTTGQGAGACSWAACMHAPTGHMSFAHPPIPHPVVTAAQEDKHRTSENAWDMTSPASIRLKKRIFELLGIRPYQEGWADGLQVLRYNQTRAYNTHHDHLEFTPGSRLDSASPGGANRCVRSCVALPGLRPL